MANQRTVCVIEREKVDGQWIETARSERAATVEVRPTRRGCEARSLETGRHANDFAQACRRLGGKFAAGVKAWDFSADRADEVAAALEADGFTVLR